MRPRKLLPGAALLALGSILVAGAPAGEPPGDAEATVAATDIDGFTLPGHTVLRVDAGELLTASRVEIRGRRESGRLVEVVMRADIDRADLLKLRPPHFGLDLDGAAMLSMDPDRPVTLVARTTPEVLASIRERLGAGGRLGRLATVQDDAGFPMLLDLANFTYQGVVQGGRP